MPAYPGRIRSFGAEPDYGRIRCELLGRPDVQLRDEHFRDANTLSDAKIVVVGAGVVGASVSLALQRDGHQVTLVDRSGPCAGASFGNAGGIVNGSCAPTAMPGAVFNALRMIGRPLSPLSIRPAYLHRILPWLIRFVLESRRSRVVANGQNLHAIANRAVEGWRQLTDNTELTNFIRDEGWLKVYESEQSFTASNDARALMDQNQTPYEILTEGEIQELEPHLAPIYERAIFQRDSLSLTDPQGMIQGMVDLFAARGGNYRQFDVQRIVPKAQGAEVRGTSEIIQADKVVIATGAWSRQFARQLGNDVPLDTERGYHLMLGTDDSALLTRPVMNGDHAFVLCPMEAGLRLTGQVEFGGMDLAPDYRKIRRILGAARRMLPAIDSDEQSVWMGLRPSLPDSLPVLGPSSNPNVLFAFGHQHLGVTLGPITGVIIADIVAGRDPGIDMTPYAASRY